MALSVTATVNPTTKTVSVLVAGGTPPYALTATPAGGSPYSVRGTWTGTSPSLTKVDAEVKLNTATQYSATDAAAGSASSSIVTVTATQDVLSDALDYTRILPVLVQRITQRALEWVAIKPPVALHVSDGRLNRAAPFDHGLHRARHASPLA